MPAPFLTAYLTMLPRLEAERDFRRVLSVAAATGSMKKDDLRRYLGELKSQMRLSQSGPRTVAELAADLGVPVVKEAKSG